MANVPLPSFTGGVDLRYFIEPLKGPKGIATYLDRFPDSLYNKSPNSRFVRFMYVLLGPTGIGWLRENLLLGRLQLEASGLQLFDLDSFYGDPFSFGRILEESFTDDITGLLPHSVWEAIRIQDESYRHRAIQYVQAARLGGTPRGMTLAATSGIGQTVEIVENYKFLFDNHSDDPIGLTHLGSTTQTGEFAVIPRPALSRSSIQTLQFTQAQAPLGSNPYTISFNGYSTAPLDDTSNSVTIQTQLEALPTIGLGNVTVSGAPAPNDVVITFKGDLSNQPLPSLQASYSANGYADDIVVPVAVDIEDADPATQTVVISPQNRHNMQVALDHLRPVASYPTFHPGRSHLSYQVPLTTTASSNFVQVTRYVTGDPNVSWPDPDNNHWIIPSVEVLAPQLSDSAHQHYVNFHNVASIAAYTDVALQDPSYATNAAVTANYPSIHVGPFTNMEAVMPFFLQYESSPTLQFTADRALPDYTELLTVTKATQNGTAFINDTYPADYIDLQGVPQVQYHYDYFWSSVARTGGAEILEVDLGSPQAVNFITFETTRKPLSIEIDYDLLDQSPGRQFVPMYSNTTGLPLNNVQLFYDPNNQNPWEELRLSFNDPLGAMIYTRFIRIMITRRASNADNAFLYDSNLNIQSPWSVEVRNLRIGRNVCPL